jgi:hypothetical protein
MRSQMNSEDLVTAGLNPAISTPTPTLPRLPSGRGRATRTVSTAGRLPTSLVTGDFAIDATSLAESLGARLKCEECGEEI